MKFENAPKALTYGGLLSGMLGGLASILIFAIYPHIFGDFPSSKIGLHLFVLLNSLTLFYTAIAMSCYMLYATKYTGLINGTLGFFSVIVLILLAYTLTYTNLSDHDVECLVSTDGSRVSKLYFSTVTFTTLGYGDIQPIGVCKILAGFEALTGTLIIPMLVAFFINAINQVK